MDVELGALVVAVAADIEPVFVDRKTDHGLACGDHRIDQIGHVERPVGGNVAADARLDQVDAALKKKLTSGFSRMARTAAPSNSTTP